MGENQGRFCADVAYTSDIKGNGEFSPAPGAIDPIKVSDRGPAPKHVQTETTRHGKKVYYFRRSGENRIRLPGKPGGAGFQRVYLAAFNGEVKPRLPAVILSDPRRREIGLSVAAAVASARFRSVRKTREFDLTEEWVLDQIERQHYRCAMTGIPFFTAHKSSAKRNPYAPSIDRIDNSRGYTPGNVRIILAALNMMLLDWGEETFRHISRAAIAQPSRED